MDYSYFAPFAEKAWLGAWIHGCSPSMLRLVTTIDGLTEHGTYRLSPGNREPGKRLRILWIAGSKIVGGAERVTLQIANLLRLRGHRFSAIYPYGSDLEAPLCAEGIPAFPASLGGSLNVRAITSIRRAFGLTRPDIALVTTSDEWVWSCLVPRRGVQTRVVLVRHMALRLPAKVTWLANLRADAVVAVSDAVRSSLSGRLGVARQRLHVIPNPVRFPIRDCLPADQLRARARESLSLPRNGRWIGFFGGTDPRKGIGDILHALVRIRNEAADCNLIVCGRRMRNAHAQSVRHWMDQCNLNGVYDLGEIDEVETVLLACDAVALPTHASLSEGLPLVLLEAMACGTPAVAYATGGAIEALGGAECAGLLARPDDPDDLARQLTKLIVQPGFAAQIAAAALDRARARFAPELAAGRYESLFLDLCRGSG